MALDLSNVERFGTVDADTDPLLDAAFEDHAAYQQAKAHQRYVIVGRKGSGKTAIYRRLTQADAFNVFSQGHIFSDYPWHHHSRQIQEGVPPEQCYVSSWEYLINITLAKILLNKDASQPWSDASLSNMSLLESFVTDTYGSRNPEVSKIFAPTTNLKIKGEFGIDWKIFKGKLTGESVPMAYLPIIIQEVNRTLADSLIECANPANDYYICFDELDLGFSAERDDYTSRLVGLLLAARKFNNRALAAGKKMSVVVFLRDDIYKVLHFEDKNKLTESAVAYIKWDSEKGGPSLKALMEKRFHSALGVPENGSWDLVFDETEQMTGRQKKYSHISDRTFLRPRDIIKFSNEVLLAHKRRGAAPDTPFANIDIAEARPTYSEYLLNELDDEIKKHYPDYQLYLEVLKGVGSLQFSPDDIGQAFDERQSALPPDLTAMEMLSRLFEYSVVGYYRPGGGGYGGADYIWKHKESRAMFNERATSYRIHPGFMEALGVKKWTKSA